VAKEQTEHLSERIHFSKPWRMADEQISQGEIMKLRIMAVVVLLAGLMAGDAFAWNSSNSIAESLEEANRQAYEQAAENARAVQRQQEEHARYFEELQRQQEEHDRQLEELQRRREAQEMNNRLDALERQQRGW